MSQPLRTSRAQSCSSMTPSNSASRRNSLTMKSNCSICQKVVDEGIQCELCMHWSHSKCLKISREVLKVIDMPGIHYYCKTCDFSVSRAIEECIETIKNTSKCEMESVRIGVVECADSHLKDLVKSSREDIQSLSSTVSENMISFRADLDKVLERFDSHSKEFNREGSEISQSYAEIAKKLEESSQNFSQNMKSQTSTIIEQLHDKSKAERSSEMRAKNVVIFGFEEMENRDDALVKVNNLLYECYLDFEATPSNTYRLGKVIPGRARPIRICTGSEFEKWEMLKRINGLHHPQVFARLDLNKQEQEQDFLLRKQLKEKRDSDPSSKYMIRQNKIVRVGQKAQRAERIE